ncbi:MAG: hypothetical protein Q9224_001214 [Gallowayella concinna]
MTAIGSLVFCTDCGNLLDGASGDRKVMITCEVCGTKNKDTSSTTITTKSKPSAFPSALRAKRSAVQTLTEEDTKTTATIQEACPQCGMQEVRFYTQQLRSADEGTTVFYSCDQCGNKWSTNN